MKKIGIIAGKGRLPILIAEQIKKNNYSIYCASFKNVTDKILNEISDDIRWFRIGELKNIIEYFSSNNVQDIILAGLVKHQNIFNSDLLDSTMKKVLKNLKDKKADSILTAISDEFKKNNINLIPIIEILKDNIAQEGLLTKAPVKPQIYKDIEFGIGIAKELSKLDIGQTIVIKYRSIVAVEAMEGTDNCILRAGKLVGSGCIVIKISKFSQDMRFDLPVIGEKTIDIMNKVKAKNLIIESEKVIILDKEKVIQKANKYSISIIAVRVRSPLITLGKI